MGRAKAEKILETFEKGISKLNSESFIQISSDGYPIPYCGHYWCENEDCVRCVELI